MRTTHLLAVASLALAAGTAEANDLEITEQQKVVAFDGQANDGFGWSLAVDGPTMCVGSVSGPGAVYVYEESAGAWAFSAKLTGSVAAPAHQFGASVSIDGDRLAVGAPQDPLGTGQGQGRVYVFERSAGVWSETATLVSGDAPGDLDDFGRSVKVDGDRIVVGDPLGDGAVQSGAVFVFDLVGGSWTQVQKLLASNAVTTDSFGQAVDLQGDRLVVGAPRVGWSGSGFIPGGAYLFERVGGVWTEIRFFPAATFGSGLSMERMGGAIALDGDRFVAGGWDTYVSGGAAVYEKQAGTWQLEQVLVPNLVRGGFGFGVDVEGDAVVAGAPYHFGGASSTGGVTLWHRQVDGWSERRRYVAGTSTEHQQLGGAVALDEGRLFGAARFADGVTIDAGAVYVFPDLPAQFGEAFCFGDGSGTSCPCNWNTFMVHGPGCQNSTAGGGAALLVGLGSASVSADDLTFTARGLVPNATALLFWRGLPKNGGLGAPFGNGLLCIGGGGGGRLGVRQGHPGDASWGPGFAASEGFLAGQTAYFQVWYRDQAAFCGQGTNMTNGFEVGFLP